VADTTTTLVFLSAIVTSPSLETSAYELTGSNSNYSIGSVAFTIPGTYDVAIYAADGNGNISLPITTEVEVTEQGFELSLTANQDTFRAGEVLTISTEAIIGSIRDYSGLVDIYFSVALPDGTIYYITDLALNITTVPTAILSSWDPGSIPVTQLLSLPLPAEIPSGDYSWKLTLIETGQAISDASNWLAQGRAVHGFE